MQARAFEPRARQQQHVERQIDAEPALDGGPNNSSIRPVPVPRSSREWNGLPARAVDDRLLHRVVGGVQLAETIPFRRMGTEIILRGLGARFAHSGQSFAVPAHYRIGGIEPLHQKPRDARAVAAVGHPKEGPGAFAMTFDQAGFRQQLEMA